MTKNEENKNNTAKCLIRGVVKKKSGQNTYLVSCQSLVRHPTGKIINQKVNFSCHFDGLIQVGTVVNILPCKPISRTKNHVILLNS